MVGASVNWFPRWKEGGARVLFSCEGIDEWKGSGTKTGECERLVFRFEEKVKVSN